MRVIKEFSEQGIRISIFSWNNKYLLKFEQGMIEQTYKISELDISNEEDLSQFISNSFLDEIQKRFDEMHQTLKNQLESL